MAVPLTIKIHLLDEAKKSDNLRKARQARELRKLNSLSRDRDFIHIYRFSEDLINILDNELAPYMKPRVRSGGLTNRIKILCTLSFLANGSYQKIIGKNLDTFVSQTSVSRAIHEVVNALNNKKIISRYIRFPQNYNERQVLKSRFYDKFKVPGVLGCVDGTLVSMVRPKEHEERYYCRKGYHARNVLIINDADLNILHVDVTFGGSTHDSFVFANTRVKEHLENLNNNGEIEYLLGDSGYPQRPYLMTPFRDPDCWDSRESLQSFAKQCTEQCREDDWNTERPLQMFASSPSVAL